MIRMARLSLLTGLLLPGTVLAQTKGQAVSSRIERVTVFTKGAQVSRSAKATLTVGRTELIVKGLSPQIDPASVQVKGEGTFTMLSVVYQLNRVTENKRTDETETLESRRRALRQKNTVDRKLLDVYKNEEKILRDNQNVSTVSTAVKTADLKELADFQRVRLTEVLLKQLEIETRIQQTDSTLVRIDQRLQNVTLPAELPSGEVVVSVLAKSAAPASFTLSYVVNGAGWYPTYDVRVNDISNPIDLSFKANVSQQSGEDWRDIRLTLSTGNPREGSVAPTLLPWNLGFGYRQASGFNAAVDGAVSGQVMDSAGEPLPGVSVSVKNTTIGTTTDANGQYTLLMPKGSRVLVFSSVGYDTKEMTLTGNRLNVVLNEDTRNLSEVVVVDANKATAGRLQGRIAGMTIRPAQPASQPLETTESYQPTTLSYDIDEPYTIPADGKVYVADIKSYSLSAVYEYVAVPKLERDAFLTARITNWQDQNLLEGEARLFFEGTYLGKTLLDVRNAGDTLSLSLGRDKGIVVERKRLTDFSGRGFLSGNRSQSRAFEITVRNNKRQPVSITVQDQFPLSTEKDIVIDNAEAPEAEVGNNTRLITWRYALPPKQARKHLLKYTVRYPKDQTVVLD
jgi:hypothetical protein